MDAEAKLADAAAKSDTFETPSEEALEAKGRAALKEAFVRRYTLDTRPWNPFHTDRYEITCNVELSAGGAESYSGGVLLGLYDGEVRRITREEGEATLHDTCFTCIGAFALAHNLVLASWPGERQPSASLLCDGCSAAMALDSVSGHQEMQ